MNKEQETDKTNVAAGMDEEKSKVSAAKVFAVVNTENTKDSSGKLVKENPQVQHTARGGINLSKVEKQLKKEDRATRPVATLSKGNRPSKKKLRGKPQAKRIKILSRSRNQVTTPKVGNRGYVTRGATISEGKESSIIQRNEVTKKGATAWSSDLNFQERIKNVKSRLFKETKSFVAYKKARLKQTEERKKKLATKTRARKAQQKYADRSIDFGKRIKRKGKIMSSKSV